MKDFNIGMVLTPRKCYASYGTHGVKEVTLTSEDSWIESYPTPQIGQACYWDQIGPTIHSFS
ncbi:MAG: hypothetical protein NXH89_04770 [Cyclobacteriaceae bacterium]|nr:hypothetical protein [Cyclobacteriaceae bacterium]